MRTQLQVHFHGIDASPALESSIREKSSKLEQFHPNVTGCRVVVHRPHHHKHQGEHFIVSIDVAVPGGKIMANHARREDVHVALRDAFFAARRQLDEHSRRLRADDKRHPGARMPDGAASAGLDGEASAAFSDADEASGELDLADAGEASNELEAVDAAAHPQHAADGSPGAADALAARANRLAFAVG